MTKVHLSPPSLKSLHSQYALENATAIEAGGLIFVSGMSGNLGDGNDNGRSFREQAENALRKISKALEEVGYSANHIIKVNCYLKDAKNFPEWNEVYKATLARPLPCRTTVCSDLVVGDIEVEVVAAVEPRIPAK